VAALLKNNWAILAFLTYCLLSVIWSDFPDVAFKRWLKFLGDHIMVLIVLTDLNPAGAIKCVLTRLGFLLLPISILFIKYYPLRGRVYASHWEGTVFYTGVTTNKNELGMICLVYGLGSSWRLLQELAGERRKKVAGAHLAVVSMAVWLLTLCDSKTSLSGFVIGCMLILVMTFFKFARRRVVLHVLVFGVLIACAAPVFLGVGDGALTTIGRNSTLTGRTDLWANILPLVDNSLFGTGFESFWLGTRLDKLWAIYWWRPNESHNGYIETFVNLGWIGIAFLAVMVGTGYRNILCLVATHPDEASLRLAYFFGGLAYNYTEAGIHTLCTIWIVFLLSIFAVPPRFFVSKSPKPVRQERRSEVLSGKVRYSLAHQG
jgi:O-antigen ligase